MNDPQATNNLPESLHQLLEEPLHVKLQLARHHMQLARLLVEGIMEEEVTEKAGERYSRKKPHGARFSRWGTNPGNVRINESCKREQRRMASVAGA